MRRALAIVRDRAPALEIGKEMRDAALVQSIRITWCAGQPADRQHDLLIMPNLDSANIGFNLVKAAADGLPIGPMLLGVTKPIHVVVPSVTAAGHRQSERAPCQVQAQKRRKNNASASVRGAIMAHASRVRK